MNNESPNNEIETTLLEKIKANQVHMKSKSYFMVKAILFMVLLVLTLIMSALVLSYIIFSLSVSGHLFLLGYGAQGIGAFLTLFPWLLLIIDLLFIFLLDRFLRYFRF